MGGKMRLPSILLAFCLGLVAVMLTSNKAWAVSYDVRNISNNSGGTYPSNRSPRINANGQIVWAAQMASLTPIQIFYYDSRVTGETPHQITSSLTLKYDPQINVKGQIVWSSGGIYYYDTRLSGEIPHLIVNSKNASRKPQINANGQVVWTVNDGTWGGQIFYYDTRVTGETPHQIITGSSLSYYPQINANGQIVWSANNGISGGQIFYYDTRVAGQNARQISNNTINNNIVDYGGVRINANGQVVWNGYERNSGIDRGIFYYDTRVSGEIQHEITNNGGGPQINANGQIIWGQYIWPYYMVFYYDSRVTGETPHQIFNSSGLWYGEGGGGVFNDSGQIVWRDDGGGIYYYDTRVAGEIPHLIAIDSLGDSDSGPQINANGQIVWVGNDRDIYLATPSTSVLSVNPTSLSPSCVRGQNAVSQSFTIQNNGGGNLSYTISDNATWLSVTPTSGTSTGEQDTITVNYATSGLAPGKYNATITISAPGATGTPKTIGLTLTVKPPSIAPLLLLHD